MSNDRNEGVSLRSATHPRLPWWMRVVKFLRQRPDLDPDALTAVDLSQVQPGPSGASVVQTATGWKTVEIPEPPTLVGKLRYVGAMKHGSFFPRWMIAEDGSWATKLSRLCNVAADEIEYWQKQAGGIYPPGHDWEQKLGVLTAAEAQSNYSRLQWAEQLIELLPKDHDGRNSWLLNYGVGEEAKALQARHGLRWSELHRAIVT